MIWDVGLDCGSLHGKDPEYLEAQNGRKNIWPWNTGRLQAYTNYADRAFILHISNIEKLKKKRKKRKQKRNNPKQLWGSYTEWIFTCKVKERCVSGSEGVKSFWELLLIIGSGV